MEEPTYTDYDNHNGILVPIEKTVPRRGWCLKLQKTIYRDDLQCAEFIDKDPEAGRILLPMTCTVCVNLMADSQKEGV